jgi:hypothetical protein
MHFLEELLKVIIFVTPLLFHPRLYTCTLQVARAKSPNFSCRNRFDLPDDRSSLLNAPITRRRGFETAKQALTGTPAPIFKFMTTSDERPDPERLAC